MKEVTCLFHQVSTDPLLFRFLLASFREVPSWCAFPTEMVRNLDAEHNHEIMTENFSGYDLRAARRLFTIQTCNKSRYSPKLTPPQHSCVKCAETFLNSDVQQYQWQVYDWSVRAQNIATSHPKWSKVPSVMESPDLSFLFWNFRQLGEGPKFRRATSIF